MKKALFLVFLIIFSSFAFADSISNYRVSPSIPLNQNLTIYGVYSGGQDILCAFYVFDNSAMDYNKTIIRLNDNYTFSDGSFYNELKIEEPLFKRGIDYNAVAKCGTTEIGSIFSVAQKEEIVAGFSPDSIASDFRFWIDSDNQISVILLLFGALVIAGFLALILSALGIHL